MTAVTAFIEKILLYRYMDTNHEVRLQLGDTVLKMVKKMAIDADTSVSKMIEQIILERVGGNTVQAPVAPTISTQPLGDNIPVPQNPSEEVNQG